MNVAVIVGVIVAGYSTTTLPQSTTPAVTCPDPDDLVVYDYFNRDYFTLMYPVDGDEVLKGSDGELTLPADEPQEIVLKREDVGFLDVSFSVRHAAAATLELTLTDLRTINLQRSASTDAVSLLRLDSYTIKTGK